MNIGGCLKEIDRHFGFSLEQMSSIGVKVIKELRHHYFNDEGLPHDGWMVIFESNDVFLVNEKVKHKVDLRPLPIFQNNSIFSLKDYSKNNVSKKILDFSRPISLV